MTFFGVKSGQDLENRTSHPHQDLLGEPPCRLRKQASNYEKLINNPTFQQSGII